ncbi:uncharacterized protein BJ171DRAFT_105393 [Polychytrium aggregatum]|uniref:uncharacterized protein n=1 Tax=Polychytrium aggregatum TaxID=110093 RepID=UPI0022FE478D|nr:uncharacterized protein BJ171DRAFT_105393 [Polychytrium aggregatum]KAI9204347.1 hypothetical protein BJ171DRAFT_105393 [Polychytrium aggregatum]
MQLEELVRSEYAAESDRMSAVLAAMGFTDKSWKNSEALAKEMGHLYQSMDCSDASTGVILAAIADIHVRESRLEREIGQLGRTKDTLSKRISMMEARREEAQRLLKTVDDRDSQKAEQTLLQSWRTQCIVIDEKRQEYHDRITDMESHLSPESADLRFSTLKSLESEVLQLASDLGVAQDQLGSYRDLPPDIRLARMQLGEKKQELARLIDRKEEVLTNIAKEIR